MQVTIKRDRLIALRQDLGLTQSEAASMIGVSQPAYQRYESGVRTPSIQVAKEIANAFNVSVDYLTGQSNKKHPDCIVIDHKESPLLFSIVEQCRDFEDVRLQQILSLINKTK